MKTIIGVMGGALALKREKEKAYLLGKLIAREGWILLNGGRSAGVMEYSAKGARDEGGITVGILPDVDKRQLSRYIDIPIFTGMGIARNCINVLSSHIVVACKGGAGTISEIAIALKSGRKVILLDWDLENIFDTYKNEGFLSKEKNPEDVIFRIKQYLLNQEK